MMQEIHPAFRLSMLIVCFWAPALISGTATQAIFNVTKTYSDSNMSAVEVSIQCNSGAPSFIMTSITPASPVAFVIEDFESGTLDCKVTENVPAGYAPIYDDGTPNDVECSWENVTDGQEFDCDITNKEIEAIFTITKEYTDSNTAAVEVTLDCNSGVPLTQMGFASPSAGAVLSVTDFEPGTLACVVTEEVPIGYEPLYDDGTPSTLNCSYANLGHGVFDCQITNSEVDPMPAILLSKTGEFVDTPPLGVLNPGDEVDYNFSVTNTGNVPLSNVKVSDPQVDVNGEPIQVLNPGLTDTHTFTATYVLTQPDFDAGMFTNTATATGEFEANTFMDEDSHTIIINTDILYFSDFE